MEYSSAALHYGGTKRLSLVNNGPCPGALATCWHPGCPGGARKGMTSAPVAMVTGWSEEASGGMQVLSWTLSPPSDVDWSQLCHSVPVYHWPSMCRAPCSAVSWKSQSFPPKLGKVSLPCHPLVWASALLPSLLCEPLLSRNQICLPLCFVPSAQHWAAWPSSIGSGLGRVAPSKVRVLHGHSTLSSWLRSLWF